MTMAAADPKQSLVDFSEHRAASGIDAALEARPKVTAHVRRPLENEVIDACPGK